jgi:4-hydroxythreonine-4-phosphate dehydrogenase
MKARAPRPRLAVSVGCPCGVGPEVSVVAAAQERSPVLLVGDVAAIDAAARVRGVARGTLRTVTSPADAWKLPRGCVGVWQPTKDLAARDRRPGHPTARAGAAQLAWIDAAADLVAAGVADALVTGPVSKEAIARSSSPEARVFLGHTEHLQRRFRAREVVMAFWSEQLTTSLVTTHLPLAKVPRAITPASVATAVYWTGWLLARLGTRRPRLAVASLNPHAGEGGLLGAEESRSLAPGMKRARARFDASRLRVEVVGPVPAETAFRLGSRGAYHAVVAMYHDQATIPMKLLGFGEAVNVTLGLPIVRTSVDHGTAYDRAGKGTADPRGMQRALALAGRLSAACT